MYPKNGMRVLHLKSHLTSKELKQRLNNEKDVRLFRYWQLLYIIHTNPGKSDIDYGNMLAMGKDNVYRIVQLYNKQGKNFTDKLQWGGRRDETSYLTLVEESKLLKGLSGLAKEGKVITFYDIHKETEKYIGYKVSDDYIWDIFNRHQWKKKAPRPKHPQQKESTQKAFKKTSRSYWSPEPVIGRTTDQ